MSISKQSIAFLNASIFPLPTPISSNPLFNFTWEHVKIKDMGGEKIPAEAS
jgi:hypothetical protein